MSKLPPDGPTWAASWAHIAPRWANIASRWANIARRRANMAPNMAPSWSKRGQHSRKLGQPRRKMRLLQTLQMGHNHNHNNNNNNNNHICDPSPSFFLYSLFMILYPQVGVGRQPLNKSVNQPARIRYEDYTKLHAIFHIV